MGSASNIISESFYVFRFMDTLLRRDNGCISVFLNVHAQAQRQGKMMRIKSYVQWYIQFPY